MKKVLFTATVDSHILQFHLPFLKMFKENGYEVHVATNGNEEIPYCDVKHVVSFERSPFKINNLKAISQLKRICNKEKFEIIVTNTPMGAVVTRLAAKRTRKYNYTRVLYMAHGFHFYNGAPLKNWLLYYPVEKFLSKYTDTLITINKEDYNRAYHKFLNKCHDIQYVPGVGIDKNKFNLNLSLKEKKDFKTSIGLEPDSFVLTYIARLDNNKNQGFMINVMKKLSKKHNNIHLLLVGPDEVNGKYHEMAKEVNNNVHFLGFRKDIGKILSITNISVSSSLREGLPVNILEAMSSGIPVIATDTRGVRDLIKDGINGFVIEKNNISSFVDKVEFLYNNENLCNKMGKQNLRDVEQYDLNIILTEIEKIFFKKKKVLHLLSSNKYSGAENVVCTIIDKMGSKYDSYYCSPNGEINDILNDKKIKYIPIKKLSYKEINKIIKKVSPDIIHAHDNKATVLASFFNRRCKIISHIHGNNKIMNSINLKSFLFNLISKRIYRFIWVSDSSLDDYYFKDKILNRSIVLYNIIDEHSIRDKAKEYTVGKKYDLIYLGRLGYPKNPLRLLKILKMVKDYKKDITLAIVGDGEDKEVMEKTVKENGLTKNVDFYGFKKNPYPILNSSNILIMTSLYEGTPMCALEAQALGKPIIATPVDGLKKIVVQDVNGFLTDDDEIFSNKIIELLKLNLKENVQKEFKKRNNIDTYLNEISKLY